MVLERITPLWAVQNRWYLIEDAGDELTYRHKKHTDFMLNFVESVCDTFVVSLLKIDCVIADSFYYTTLGYDIQSVKELKKLLKTL